MHNKKTLWKNDNELYIIAKKELFVALVGDILDKMGFQHQFLPPGIKHPYAMTLWLLVVP